MIRLQNSFLTVQINEFGAELSSVKNAEGREYIWQGDEKFWTGHSPVLFPICGRLKGQQYRYGGETYSMGTHGFARHKTFSAERLSDTCALFTLTDDEETRAQYPFSFRFTVRFELNGDVLRVTDTAENTGEKTMYFNFGSHEAFAADGNFEDWSVEFEKTEDLRLKEQPVLGYLGHNSLLLAKGAKELALSYPLFENDSLIFDGLQSRTATLKHCGKAVASVDFHGFDHLLLWTKIGAPYICIEPWDGLPDFTDSDGDITRKPAIRALEAGKTFSMTHSIRFF